MAKQKTQSQQWILIEEHKLKDWTLRVILKNSFYTYSIESKDWDVKQLWRTKWEITEKNSYWEIKRDFKAWIWKDYLDFLTLFEWKLFDYSSPNSVLDSEFQMSLVKKEKKWLKKIERSFYDDEEFEVILNWTRKPKVWKDKTLSDYFLIS